MVEDKFQQWCEDNWDDLAQSFVDKNDKMFSEFCWEQMISEESNRDDMIYDQMRDEAIK